MNVQALLEASVAVQVHVAAGAFAFASGAWLLARRKGGPVHRLLGRSWIAAMVIVSLSAMFIRELRMWGEFSPLHLFVPITLVSCWLAVRYARRRNLTAHRQTVIGLYLGGVIGAGGVTFLPGRLMHDVFLRDGATYAALPGWVMSPVLLPFALAALAFLIGMLWRPAAR